MTAGDLILELAKRAGMQATDKALIDVLSKSEFATTLLPESVSNALTTNLLTVEAAKNNSDIKKHFYGNALDPINEKIKAFITEYGIDEDAQREIMADKSTYSQFEKTVKKIAELKSKVAGSDDKGEKAELQKKINELNQKVSTIVTETQSKVDDVRNEYEEKLLNKDIEFHIAKKPLPGTLDPSIEASVAKQIVFAKLAEKGGKVKLIDGNMVLVDAKDENLRIYDNGKELSFDALTDSALAEKKFIKVSTQPQGNGTPYGGNPANGGQPQKLHSTAQNIIAEYDEAIKSLS